MANIQILVVDDNPMIRDLIRQGLESYGDIHLAANGDEALNQLATVTPDLAVVDAELGSNGEPRLLEELHRRLSAPMILLAARDAGGESHHATEEGGDEILEKPFFIRDLQSRVRRLVERVQLERLTRSLDGNAVRGTLAQMSVTDLLQSLEMGRKSCCLTLTGTPAADRKAVPNPASGTQRHCEMYFVEGQLVHAASGWLLGDEAVFDALRWLDEGNFEIDFQATTDLHTTTRSTQALLMEGMRLLDEANRDASAADCSDDTCGGEAE